MKLNRSEAMVGMQVDRDKNTKRKNQVLQTSIKMQQ